MYYYRKVCLRNDDILNYRTDLSKIYIYIYMYI
jgi:hypothetical protein